MSLKIWKRVLFMLIDRLEELKTTHLSQLPVGVGLLIVCRQFKIRDLSNTSYLYPKYFPYSFNSYLFNKSYNLHNFKCTYFRNTKRQNFQFSLSSFSQIYPDKVCVPLVSSLCSIALNTQIKVLKVHLLMCSLYCIVLYTIQIDIHVYIYLL